MKNLLNCHCIGVHSFPISYEEGLYRRIFYADINHVLYKPIEIAIHPHHVDVKITVLEGTLYNLLYVKNDFGGCFKKFQYNSQILNGNGGFEYLGEERLVLLSNKSYSLKEGFSMKSNELHTVQVEKDKVCVWLVEESYGSKEYNSINYSHNDLTKWTPGGLYIEVDNEVKMKYIGKYLSLV